MTIKAQTPHPDDRSCLDGGKRHSVDKSALVEARQRANPDGSYTLTCVACGKTWTKGPTDLSGSTLTSIG